MSKRRFALVVAVCMILGIVLRTAGVALVDYVKSDHTGTPIHRNCKPCGGDLKQFVINTVQTAIDEGLKPRTPQINEPQQTPQGPPRPKKQETK